MIDVTCAVIRNEEREVLIVQRSEASDHPFKWEFPGGKVSEGETGEDCIVREIKEELSIDIVIVGMITNVEYDYGHKQIRLIPFICDTLEEKPVLHEHIAWKWISAGELSAVDFSEADIYVAEEYAFNYSEESRKADDWIGAKDDSTESPELQQIVNNMMSMKEADWVADSAIENPAVFRKLLEYSMSDEKHLAFRASWTLTKVCDKIPEIIYPYLAGIIDALAGTDNEGSVRSFMRIISLGDINKIDAARQGHLTDFCFNILKSGSSSIAVKAYSMEILYKLTLIYPELGNELIASINILMDDGSAGITSRGRTILRKLAEMSVKPGKP